MNVGSFGVDVYSAQFFSGLSETPCLLIPLVRLGRRALSILTLLLSGASCFLSLLLSIMDGDLPKLFQNYVFLYLSSLRLIKISKDEAIDASCFAAPPEVTMTLALLGKLCILASIFVSVLYSIELFPTVVRYVLSLPLSLTHTHTNIPLLFWYRNTVLSVTAILFGHQDPGMVYTQAE